MKHIAYRGLALLVSVWVFVASDVRSQVSLPLAALQEAAEKNDRAAQFRLGLEYEHGWRTKQDYDAARQWYRRAAEAGHAQAASNLGHLYKHARGVPQDYEKANFWYRKSSDAGHPDGQNRLAVMYIDGKGVERDYEKAAGLLKLAANQAFEKAQKNLGTSYFKGLGVERSLKTGMRWFQESAKNGFLQSQQALAQLYLNGDGAVRQSLKLATNEKLVEKNEKEAFTWFALAARRANAAMQRWIADVYRRGEKVPKDDQVAMSLYLRGAEQGDLVSLSAVVGAFANGSRWAPADIGQTYYWTLLYKKNPMFAQSKRLREATKEFDHLFSKLSEAQKSEFESLADKWSPKSPEHADRAAQLMMDYLRIRKAVSAFPDVPDEIKNTRSALLQRKYVLALGYVLSVDEKHNEAFVRDILRYRESVPPVILLEAARRTPPESEKLRIELYLLGLLRLSSDVARCEGNNLLEADIITNAAYRDLARYTIFKPETGLNALRNVLRQDAVRSHTSPPIASCRMLYRFLAAHRKSKDLAALGGLNEVPKRAWTELKRLNRIDFQFQWFKRFRMAQSTK